MGSWLSAVSDSASMPDAKAQEMEYLDIFFTDPAGMCTSGPCVCLESLIVADRDPAREVLRRLILPGS